MHRHAEEFRQKCLIKNSRHTVIKRERISLNWFELVQNLFILFNEVKSMEEHAGISMAQAR